MTTQTTSTRRFRLLLPVMGALALISLAGCKPPPQGPAERAGASVDRAGEKLRDTIDPPQGPAESLGRKLDRATTP